MGNAGAYPRDNSYSQNKKWQLAEHPFSFLLALLLILVAPFTTKYLVFAAFGICLFRLCAYSATSFLRDVAWLMCFSNLFRSPSGDSLFSLLLLFGVALLLVKKGARANAALAFAVMLIALLTLRMQGDFSNYIWIAGSVLVTVLLADVMRESDIKTILISYCIAILASSFFALFFRNFSMYNDYVQGDALAIWGEEAIRFKGLFSDANYYAFFLILALSLLVQLYFSRNISLRSFSLMGIATVIFGLMTYGKTFFLVLLLLVACFIVFLFAKRKVLLGMVVVLAVGIFALLTFSGKMEALSVIIARFKEADNVNDLTTGRFDSWKNYLQYIFADVKHFAVGYGLRAPLINKLGTHNLYLEIAYYLGIGGLLLFVALAVALRYAVSGKDTASVSFATRALKGLSLLAFLVFYFSLQGMFTPLLYLQYLLAVSGGLLFHSKTEKVVLDI